jgi:hypothetical protein
VSEDRNNGTTLDEIKRLAEERERQLPPEHARLRDMLMGLARAASQ